MMRGYVWFLEEKQGSKVYQAFYDDVQQGLSKMTYRALVGLAIDVRLWEEAHLYKDYLKAFDESWHGGGKVQQDFYFEITGKTLAVYAHHGQEYFEFAIDDHEKIIALPLRAIISYRSTGFPKVAYAIDQYVEGYIAWLDAFADWLDGNRQPLSLLMAKLRSENLSNYVYQQVLDIVTIFKQGNEDKESLNKRLKGLSLLMARSMIEEVPGRCKPPYHHPLEWGTPKALLQRDHLLVRTYLTLREVYPTMVVRSVAEAIKEESTQPTR